MPDQKSNLPLAVQLYTLRHLEQSLDEQLGQVAAIGYAGIETLGDHGLSADEMKGLLAKHQLKVISAHVGLAAFQSDLDGVITFNKAIDNDVLTIPAIPQEQRPTDAAGWATLGKTLDALGQQCAAAGMRLLYHNHAWEMETFDGKLAIDLLMENTAPANLQLELDLAWVVRGNADPVALLQRYQGRCPRVHAKDVARAGENEDQMGFADVGDGTIDWATLLPMADAAGAEWYIVEHDLPKDPIQTIRRSFEFLCTQLA